MAKGKDKLGELQDMVSMLDGLRRALAEDLLAAYVDVYDDYQKLDALLSKEGLLIDVEKGGADNRHVVKTKNPAFDMRRNCISQMADLANKITRFVKEDGYEPEDEFDAFLSE